MILWKAINWKFLSWFFFNYSEKLGWDMLNIRNVGFGPGFKTDWLKDGLQKIKPMTVFNHRAVIVILQWQNKNQKESYEMARIGSFFTYLEENVLWRQIFQSSFRLTMKRHIWNYVEGTHLLNFLKNCSTSGLTS